MMRSNPLQVLAAHAVRALPDIVGLAGFGLIVEGFREIWRPAAFIVAGVLLVAGAMLHARGRAAIAATTGASE